MAPFHPSLRMGYGCKMVDPGTAPQRKAAKWSRHLQHHNGAKHQWWLPSLPAYVRLLAHAVPNEHKLWNSQFIYSFHYTLLMGKRAAEFTFLIRRSLSISSSAQRMLCIAAVQGRLLRVCHQLLFLLSLPFQSMDSSLNTIRVHSCYTITLSPRSWIHLLQNDRGCLRASVKWWLDKKKYGDKNRMHFSTFTFRVRDATCLSDIAMSLNKRL